MTLTASGVRPMKRVVLECWCVSATLWCNFAKLSCHTTPYGCCMFVAGRIPTLCVVTVTACTQRLQNPECACQAPLLSPGLSKSFRSNSIRLPECFSSWFATSIHMHVMYLLVVIIFCYMVLLIFCYMMPCLNDHALHSVESLVQVSGRIEYLVAPFWKQKYCRKHDDSNTPRCCSCNRLKASGQLWLTLSDQRMVCQDCSKSVVQDTQQAQPLYDDVSLQRHCAVLVWSFFCCSLFWKLSRCVMMQVTSCKAATA